MRIFITKNGQQLGPYTLEQVQAQVAAGTLEATDWAWYDGQTDWAPINHIPGFSAYDAAIRSGSGAPPAPVQRRPVLVWVVSILSLISVLFSLLALAAIPFMLSSSLHMDDANRAYLESLGVFDYAIAVLIEVLFLAGAVLLFFLQRSALYCFVISFGLEVLDFIYEIVFKDYLAAFESTTLNLVVNLTTFGLTYLFCIAVIAYTGYLYFNKTLR